jgi:molybdate transport system substrate-binding protein
MSRLERDHATNALPSLWLSCSVLSVATPTLKPNHILWRRAAFAAVLLLSLAQAPAATIRVFAAASLMDSLKEISAAYRGQTGDTIVFNFGASSFLARQIEEGAPADIFFSADDAKMDALEAKGHLAKDTRRNLLSNSLVIVTASDSELKITSAADLGRSEVKRVALGNPKTVPAGIYAKAYLTKAKLWPAVSAKIVPTDNVRAALAAVESGNVGAGMVYKTDAAISKQVKIVCEISGANAPDIRYPMALLKEAKEPEAAQKFLVHLASDEAGRVFEKFGFILRR